MKRNKTRKRSFLVDLVMDKLVMNVLAEEPNAEQSNGSEEETKTPETTKTPEQTVPQPTGTVNFEDLVRKAREEEKNKLYPQIEKLKKDKNDLLLVVAEREATIKEQEKTITDLQKNHSKLAKDVEESTSTNKVVQEQALLISQLEQQLEETQSQYETEMNSLKLNSYRDGLIAQAGGEIIAELVTGNTEEEINASIELAKQRYAEIQEKALSNVQMPKSINPSTSMLQQNALKSVDDIAGMDNKAWEAYRADLKAQGLLK